MLKDELKNSIVDYIRQKNITKHLNLQKDFRVEFLAQGEYNINYTIEDELNKYVFRVNTGSQLELENQISYEYNALNRLEVSGVTPKTYFVDDSKDFLSYGVLIMEFLKGKPLDYNKDLYKASEIFAKIHSISINVDDYKSFVVENNIFQDRIKEGKRLLDSYLKCDCVQIGQKNFFYKFIQWLEDNKYKEIYFTENKWHVINNTEVNSHNFIIGNERNYLIDWEKPVVSDPCQDLTQFLAETTTLWKTDYILSKDEKEKFFKIYEEMLQNGKGDIRERVELYTPYLYFRALSWCAYAWIEYQRPDKNIKNMDTLNKIEQYLQLDFMRKLLNRWF